MYAHAKANRHKEQLRCSEELKPIVHEANWLRVYMEWVFILYGIDPFKIYKVQDKLTLSIRSGEPLMRAEPFDGLRDAMRRGHMLIFVPVGSHLLALGFAKMLGAISLRATGRRRAGDSKQTADNTDLTLRWFNQASRYLGDPIARSPQLASLICIGLSIANILLFVIIPKFSELSAYDASSARFVMKPNLEISVVDRFMRQQLDSIKVSFTPAISNILEQKRAGQLRRQYRMVSEGQLDERFVLALRPTSYSSEGHKLLSTLIIRLIVMFTVVGLSMGLTLATLLAVATVAESPNEDPLFVQSQSNFSYVFGELDWRQRITFIELSITILASAFGINIVTGGFLLQTSEQLGWIDKTGKELSSMHAHLRDRTFLAPDNAADIWTDFLLLKAIVHLNFLSNLAGRSTKVQTQLISALAAIALICLTLTISSRILLGLEIQLALLVFVMIYTNSVLLMAAAMPSREIKIKKIVWSILAEQARANQLTNGFAMSKLDDPLVDLWRRRVLNDEFISSQHQVYALGIGLTFRRVLEANLLVLSIVGWLRTLR